MSVNRIQLTTPIPSTNTNILTTTNFHIVTFDRNNYHELRNVIEIKQNGIYILYNNDTHYIGQNSSQNGLISRLDNHYKNKDWWTKGLFFTPTNQSTLFTKAHYDYIERILIQRFQQKQIKLDNKTIGNISPISTLHQNECEIFMSEIIITMKYILGLDIFALNYVSYLETMINKLLDNTLDEDFYDQK